MFDRFRDEIRAIKQRDPAARSAIEILLLYPGFKAIRMHRKANWFFRHNMKFFARYISQRAVKKTGIEIHPGATLGHRVFIDHGTGVVIGETAVVGDDVTIYLHTCLWISVCPCAFCTRLQAVHVYDV